MAEHTPGPLTTEGPEDSGIDRSLGGEGDYTILDADGWMIGAAYQHIHFVEERPARENALLWAAAPNLLAACEVLVEDEWTWCRCEGKDHLPGCPVPQALGAIAKAKGE